MQDIHPAGVPGNKGAEMMEILAQVPTVSFGEIGNFAVTGAAVLVILNTAFGFWKDHLREQPSPSETYVKIPIFEKRTEELMERIEEATGKIEKFSSDNYEARGRMHQQINAHANTLHYLAGALAREGKHGDATHVRELMRSAEAGS